MNSPDFQKEGDSKNADQKDFEWIAHLLRYLRQRLWTLRILQSLAATAALGLFAWAFAVPWLRLFGNGFWSKTSFFVLAACGVGFLIKEFWLAFLMEPLDEEALGLRLEKVFSSLDSQLISVIQFKKIQAPPFCQEAFHADVRRRLEEVPYRKILPWRRFRIVVLLLVLALAAAGLTRQYWPQAFSQSLRTLLQITWAPRAADLKKWIKAAAEEPWAVGDIEIEYFFPPYSGLANKIESNSDGSIRALKGTTIRLTATSSEKISKAELNFKSGSHLPLVVAENERRLKGEFSVLQDDDYGFSVELRANAPGKTISRSSRRIPITQIMDENPTIEITEPAADLEVNEAGIALIKYRVGDDFGLSQLKLMVIANPASDKEWVINRFAEHQRATEGQYEWDLRELKIQAGQEVSFVLRVYDNDAISGPKYTDSSKRKLLVKSTQAIRKEWLAQEEQIFTALLESLADHLEFPDKAATENIAESFSRWQILTKRLADVSQGLSRIVQALEHGKSAKAVQEANRPEEYLKQAQRLLESIQAQWATLGIQKMNEVNVGVVTKMIDLARRADPDLEKIAISLERTIQLQKAAELIDQGKDLLQRFNSLDDAFKRLAEQPGAQDFQTLMQQLQEFQQAYASYMQKMAQNAEQTPLDDFVNLDALKEMQKESVEGYLERIKQYLQAGDLEAARQEMSRLRENMQKWEKSLQKDNLKKQQEMSQKLGEGLAKLDDAIAGQKRLVQSSEQLYQKMQKRTDRSFKNAYKDFFEKQIARIMAIQKNLDIYGAELRQQSGPQVFLELARELKNDASLGLEALKKDFNKEDLESARQRAEENLSLLQRLKGAGELMYRTDGNDESTVQKKLRTLEEMAALAQKIVDDLEQAGQQSAAPKSPEDKAEAARLKQAQEGLRKRSLEIADHMNELGKEMPIFDDDLFGKEEGEKRFPEMRDAGGRLSEGNVPEAIPLERNGLFRLEAAREKIKEALKKMQEQGGGQGSFFLPGMPSSGSGLGSDNEKVQIPNADQYQVPQEFRKEIMDAMKKPAPKNFDRLNKHYYEELVH